MIAVIDYNAGNISSLTNILDHIKINYKLTSDYRDLENSEKIILPGVSNFGFCMKNLIKLNFVDSLKEEVLKKKKKILGICSGMQIMSLYSEESDDKGLGFIKGNVIRLKNHKTARVPHFGWNKVFHNSDILFLGINQKERFYFCHSYYLDCYEDKSKLYFTKYGIEFCCGFHIDNIFGLQFHPEKSFESGKKLIQNFCQYT